MTPHTITPAVEAVFRCKAKAGLRRSPRGLRTLILPAEIESAFVAKDDLVPFRRSPVALRMANGGVDEFASRAAHGTGANVLQPGAFL
ncbi:hypothetical protein TNCV_3074141 [Trichonephila clavipes]|uniref:Uncharacterized protein n=1 Tax=Trichonephila clavipes TaxID=2585209 RepID=A0A8X6SFR8_TRICX|nr:hypothetical protein TNCV_3074141 [Trichonephila clavipes]